jgi:peptidyl-prolyl cis-trans isomerase D
MIRFLQSPGKIKKIILGGILVVICGAMVITLVPGGILGDAFGTGSASPNSVARVGNQEVTVPEVEELARQMLKQQSPKGAPAQFVPFMRQRAVESLIMQKALLVEAQRMGLTISDEELRSSLRQIPELFPNGKFVGEQAYQNFVVQATNLTVPEFERRLKDDLLVNKLRGTLEAGLTVSDNEIQRQFERENTKVKFQYAVVSLNDLEKSIHPSEKELRDFYDKNKQRYADTIPEQRKAEYILIDTASLEAKAKPTQQEVQQYYNENQDQYRVPDEVEVRHILVRTPAPDEKGKVDEKAVEQARQKAQALLDKLKKGADFAELAKKNSDDPGSAAQGGSLGWIQRGQTVPEFEQTAFSLPVGQISGLVRTTFGFHIIQVEDKQQAHLKPLSEVQPEIEKTLAAQKAADMAEALANKVQAEARTSSLQSVAQQNGLQVVTTDLFSRNDTLPGLGSAPEFMGAVFNAGAEAKGEMVHLPQGYAIFDMLQVEPAKTPTFEQAKDRVQEDFRTERGQQMLSQKTQQLSDRAHALNDLSKAARELGAQLKTSDLVGLNDQVPDLGAMNGVGEVALEMKPGEISGPINTGQDGAVLELTDKQAPPQEALAASKGRIQEELLQQKRNQFFSLFVDNLRQRMEADKQIQINQQVMNQIVKTS